MMNMYDDNDDVYIIGVEDTMFLFFSASGEYAGNYEVVIKETSDELPDSLSDMKNFLQARWKGITPVMMGKTLREAEMTRGMYELLFNVNGGRRK